MAQAPDIRSQTFVDAFWPLQKLLDNNAISPSAYKAICAILEQELDNGPMQSEQQVISVVQSRAQAQVPPTGISSTPPPSAQGQGGDTSSNQPQSRGLGDDDQSRGFLGGHHHHHGGQQQGYGPPGYFTGQSGYYAGPYQSGYPQGPPGYQQGYPQQGYQQQPMQQFPQNMSSQPILGGGGGGGGGHQQHQVTNFAQRMGNIVVSSMAGGFGGTLGSQAAHSLWNKF